MKYNSLIGKVIIFVTLFVGVTLLVNFPVEVEAQNTDIESTLNRPIIFGLRDNAPPVSDYRDHNSWEGYCHIFLNSLEKRIKQQEGELNIINFNIERKTVSSGERFSGYAGDERLDGECGPNTDNPNRRELILKEEKDGQFSETFAITGAKILLKKANAKDFYSLQPFKSKKIGVIGKSTTNTFIGKIYQEAEIISVKREEVVEKLINDSIDAYVSDEIILKGILNEMNFWQRINYIIVPKFTSLSYEKYGMVVYQSTGKNQKLLKYINELIKDKYDNDQENEYQFPGYLPNTFLDKIYGIYYKFDSFIMFILIPFSIVLVVFFFIKITRKSTFWKALKLAGAAAIEHRLDSPIITFFKVFCENFKKK